jgi:hypothetical protein
MRKTRTLGVAGAALAAVMGPCGVARADGPAFVGAVWVGPVAGDRVHKQGASSSDDASAFLGASMSLRFDDIVVGASADTAFALFGHSEGYVAGHVGWSKGVGQGRFTVVGEAGQHSYSGLGSELFAELTSTPVALPFIGIRATADLALGRNRSSLIGWWFALRTDLGTATAESTGAIASRVAAPSSTGPGRWAAPRWRQACASASTSAARARPIERARDPTAR